MKKNSRVLILADLEGITDVYNLKNDDEAITLYNDEICMYIETLIENKIFNIDVCDIHNKGNMISKTIERYNDDVNIRLISTISNLRFENEYDFAFLVGFHGMNRSCGILPHTIRFNFKEIKLYSEKLNLFIPIGEVELYSRWLGSRGIPVILITGDREACYEGNCFNPYRETCCVKSLFENIKIQRALIYSKIKISVDSAINLIHQKCLADDKEEILVELYNEDLTEFFSSLGYKKNENNIIFENCFHFIENLDSLIYKIIDFDRDNLSKNIEFLDEIKKVSSLVSKDKVVNSDIGNILSNNNLYSLDSKMRDKVKLYFQDLIKK